MLTKLMRMRRTAVRRYHSYITDQNIEAIVQHLEIKSDLSTNNFALLREVIGNTGVTLQTLSWSEWNKDKSKLKNEQNSFFMIDHDLYRNVKVEQLDEILMKYK